MKLYCVAPDCKSGGTRNTEIRRYRDFLFHLFQQITNLLVSVRPFQQICNLLVTNSKNGYIIISG